LPWAQRWRTQCLEKGYDIPVHRADVSDFDQCKTLIAQVEEEHGPIDILVNNAGVTRDTTLRKMTQEQWATVMRIDLDSVFNMTQPLIGGMAARGFGRVINISSINGQKGQLGQANYSAAKAGMHGFSMAVAQEVARKGVTVKTVSPGYIATEMVLAVAEEIRNRIIATIPMARLGRPEEIANVVNFLASDEASFITGANISVNGGQFMN
jgi:acetoacetyl-CoA reductase